MTRDRSPRSSSPRPVRTRPTAWRSLVRAASWHRRKLAVVAALAAVLTGVDAAMPPEPPSTEVVRTISGLGGGTVLGPSDVRLVRVPVEVVPDGVLTDVPGVLGRTVTAPVAAGQMLTAEDLVPPGRSARRDRVVAPLRLADADLVALLHVGDAVDVVAADGEARAAAVVARGVRIVALPRAPDPSGADATTSTSAGALLLVEVTPSTATTLAQAAVSATLSVVLR